MISFYGDTAMVVAAVGLADEHNAMSWGVPGIARFKRAADADAFDALLTESGIPFCRDDTQRVFKGSPQ